ncbi:MAG: hypothetical protein BWY63_02848 [Chloroflexi bacterium ADurb.Bin360]|nr:MAG: hypothetical protein BWY63_02848 [Chloroflexi bacterium ADurb.Bin360]
MKRWSAVFTIAMPIWLCSKMPRKRASLEMRAVAVLRRLSTYCVMTYPVSKPIVRKMTSAMTSCGSLAGSTPPGKSNWIKMLYPSSRTTHSSSELNSATSIILPFSRDSGVTGRRKNRRTSGVISAAIAAKNARYRLSVPLVTTPFRIAGDSDVRASGAQAGGLAASAGG